MPTATAVRAVSMWGCTPLTKKTLALACLLAAFAAPSAHATAGTCLSLTDPSGDEVTAPLPVDVAPPLNPGATDLLAVDAVASTTGVTATFQLDAAPTPPPGLSFGYGLTFTKHEVVDGVATDTHYTLRADIGASVVPGTGDYSLLTQTESYGVDADGNPTGSGVTAGPAEQTAVDGSADLTDNTVTVVAPADAFGSAGLPDGQTFTMQGASTGRGVAGVVSFDPYDTAAAASGTTLSVGDGTCA